jgi:hypothetical protein
MLPVRMLGEKMFVERQMIYHDHTTKLSPLKEESIEPSCYNQGRDALRRCAYIE